MLSVFAVCKVPSMTQQLFRLLLIITFHFKTIYNIPKFNNNSKRKEAAKQF